MKANDDTVKVMRVLVDAFNREAEIYRDLTLANSSIGCAELTDLFNTMKWIMACQSEMVHNLSSQMEEKLGTYFYYFRDELSTIKDATASLDIKAQKYAKKDSKLYTRKEKLYQEGNPKSWDIKPEELKKVDVKEFTKDKSLVMKLMLPKVIPNIYILLYRKQKI